MDMVTKRGSRGDVVPLGVAADSRLSSKDELHRLLDEAEADELAGDRGVTVATSRRRLRR